MPNLKLHSLEETCPIFKTRQIGFSQIKDRNTKGNSEITKGQIISKGLLASSNSTKKQTNKFVFTTTTNSFLFFFSKNSRTPNCPFEIIRPLERWQIRTSGQAWRHFPMMIIREK